MKHPFLVAALGCLIIGVNVAALQAESKSGKAKFTPGGSEAVNVTMGSKMKLDATFKVISIGPSSAVSVKGTVKNTSGGKMYYSYFVAFMDKDKNLIGCQNFSLFMDGGKDGLAGTFIQLPPEEISRIAYYSVAFYESDKQIGSK
jgi:hypothetical protein